MRVTNSERREVAARLRYMRKRMDGETPPQGVTRAASEYLLRIAYCVKLGSSGNLFNRLADLVDTPTAHAIQRCPGAFYECSACGQDAWVTKDKVTRFCPNCGALMVRREEK